MSWLILIIPIFYLYYRAHKNTYYPNLSHIKLKLNSETPTIPIRILHLSDLHMEKISVTPKQLKQKLEDNTIDLIALTGDYLDKYKSIDKFLNYLSVLHQLKPKYGIYVVFGNHDYLLKSKIDHFQQIIEETGAVVLRNENKVININGQDINIIGIDDYKTKRSDIKKSYEGIKPGINLVLTHDPNIVLKMNNYHFDYLLSGHFHGGQIFWPKPFHLIKMGKLPRKKIIKGLNFHENKPFYINEGLGQTALNIRLGSRPEITLHTLIS
ncbi:metallophosphoesterase [Vulcanibacillus modesticaldus]|uniref:Metallophosphoesterase n=1 Tax=Vulcanibacillus modesticaldus TaxID=337097 RepID=A0A1D2YVG4_9BACI|nr:metallophosphoesterase [Vulcanibacillus modesticaldus]OEF99606.1 metallophosphoesterase [Vulcanibacillus modesticaldus]